ncbi:Clavaminate synthase-like protein [Fomitiporia mediterranea MF3/22]|uniref:Clavaminate synthase-like protein n=1 Tax=Fomitiporia mediterranea (strain MF3/22) TaxID=694068 RepID=UPI0004407284|nr:Clavaminate synthase-like protein [Fomitiporia mediterranea MF3/22]EJD06912.1 Clavaminate synthase-like protein [Fomitiporia mediterranea MF3/22]
MPGLTLPPFPDNIPIHPLLVIDYELLKAGDNDEIEKLWKAATELGFWYLKNHGADEEVNGMFDWGAETMALPLEEKLKFAQGEGIKTYGYKPLGHVATNEYGSPDNIELFNVSKEDVLAYPDVVHTTYPSTVNARMESTIIPFTRKSLDVVETTMTIFEKKLGLPAGAIMRLHPLMEPSGCEARVIKSPPKYTANPDGKVDMDKVSLGAHTDFGSLSFLHNRLGGLQVLPPGSQDWYYVRPMPGHAICNIGDALSMFSGGALRSNMHRIVPPPGAQAAYPRWSVVFFSRPANTVRLRALEEGSVVKEALSRMSPEDRARYDPNVTQGEWYARRMDGISLKNRKGPETYRASRGMEHKPGAV